jgi:hypothetical protein
MKVVGVMGRIGHKFMDLKTIKNTICETRKELSKSKGKAVVNSAVGLALLVGVVAVVTPIVKAQMQRGGEVEDIEMVSIQESTADFLKLNTMAVNYANSTLGDVYAFVQSGFSEEQREVLLAKKYGLMEYKAQLSPSNPLFLDLSENTIQKVTILLTAIDNFLDHSSTPEEDMVKLNLYTNEYKVASEKEQQLLISLLDYAGMNYEVLPNGQIKYSYLKVNE